MRLRKHDVAVAVLVAFLQVGGTRGAAVGQLEVRPLDVTGLLLLTAGPAALLLRRRLPEIPLAVSLAALIAYLWLDFPRGPVFLALVVALVTCVLTGRRVAAVLAAVTVEASVVVALAVGEIGLGEVVGATAWLLVVIAVSEVVRSRVAVAQQTRRSFEQEQLRQAGEERLRVARELHDVLAHSISLISVQAGVALHLMDDQPHKAREALVTIKQVSGEGLRDLRRTLRVLREDAAVTPTPDLTGLDRLLDGARSTGLAVTHDVRGTPRPLDAPVGLAAYRVVQEALTNVSRHAGGQTARVTLTYDEAALEVYVDDDGPAIGASGDGHGLQGMRERVTALGGQLWTGPRPDGGFSVHATLPL